MLDTPQSPYSDIEAIPTEYKGFIYKSKLEAQHAKFFNMLGLDFLYEPERFYWKQQTYLPDFKLWLPDEVPRWIEVKGPMYKEAEDKAILLARRTGILVQIWAGSWGNQTIYSYQKKGARVLSSNSKQFDAAFRHWPTDQLKIVYEESHDIR